MFFFLQSFGACASGNIIFNIKYPLFGYVIDYLYGIAFQDLGSPHHHALLWLNNAPKQVFNEDKERVL